MVRRKFGRLLSAVRAFDEKGGWKYIQRPAGLKKLFGTQNVSLWAQRLAAQC
jgi:hypothetical protein